MLEQEDTLETIAMTMILHAGNSRAFLTEALELIETADFEKAKLKLQEAKKEIVFSHKAQTNLIQAEAGGAKQETSLLFAHAQDTMMTVKSELNIANRLIKIFAVIHERLLKLENNQD
ncbi:PTS lactose/cellobiose transporter subunit IIA [Paenibacillus phocaensis]|uniref:PTS lactose/cellobiose transporter subunit IIA n=1 Tax=Paenibacillus phocaensis TaxID=1776378 RepID=UPI0003A66E57|nr:PTS lactose/cellobiose transporter subunit IIA [Paenibacillus phocaensis]